MYKSCRKQHKVLNLVVFVDFQHAIENFVFLAVFVDFDTPLFCVFGPCSRKDVVLLFKNFLVGNKFRKHAERVKISAEFAQHILERSSKSHFFNHRLNRVGKRVYFGIRNIGQGGILIRINRLFIFSFAGKARNILYFTGGRIPDGDTPVNVKI